MMETSFEHKEKKHLTHLLIFLFRRGEQAAAVARTMSPVEKRLAWVFQ